MQSPEEFDKVTENGRRYREITFPIGTFRMYEDIPGAWIQADGISIVQRINDAFDSGEVKK